VDEKLLDLVDRCPAFIEVLTNLVQVLRGCGLVQRCVDLIHCILAGERQQGNESDTVENGDGEVQERSGGQQPGFEGGLVHVEIAVDAEKYQNHGNLDGAVSRKEDETGHDEREGLAMAHHVLRVYFFFSSATGADNNWACADWERGGMRKAPARYVLLGAMSIARNGSAVRLQNGCAKPIVPRDPSYVARASRP
jgi:hypothetical protein